MADFQINPISNLSEHGLIIDTAPSSIPQNAFSDGKNVRFANGAVNKMEGEVLLNTIPEDTNLDTIYQPITSLTGHTLGAAKYIAYWPNPNLGGKLGYYIYVMEVLDANNVPLAHRIYLQDQEGNRVDVTPANLTNKGDGNYNYPGFDIDGSWQHTLFSGGFAFIINNGIQKPQFILDVTNDTVLADLGTFHELPGWDSYFATPVIHNDTYGTGDPTVYDLAQKVDFATSYIEVNGTNSKAAQAGTPAGTGTLNGTNFVPGDYPSTIPTVTGNHFQIYHDTATGTTKVVIGGLADGDTITVSLKSRNPVTVRCGVIRAFKDLLVAGNLVETDHSSGAIVRQLTGVVRTSDVATPGTVPNNWNPFEAGVNTADEFTLSDTNVVQDLISLQGSLYIYTTSSIHVMKLTNNTDAPVAFSPVTDTYGTLTTDAIVEYDGKHFVIGKNDIYIFPGHPANIQSVSDSRTRQYFFDNLSPLHEQNLFSLLNYAQDEIWICYPTINSISGECDEALIWNYRDNTWTKRDLEDVISGDVGPVRGGGIPVAEVNLTSGESGEDAPLNLGRQEVQTLAVTEQIRAAHTGVGQTLRLTIPTTTQYSAQGVEQLGLVISGDAGANVSNASHTLTFPSVGLFTLSTAVGGGIELELHHTNNTTTTEKTINGNQLFTGVQTSNTKTGIDLANALADFINNITAESDTLFDYTATVADTTVTLTSNVPGNRTIDSATLTAYVTNTTAASGTGSNQSVAVTRTTGWTGASGTAISGTGGTSEVPFYSVGTDWTGYGTTQKNVNAGLVFPSTPETINRLQSFTGGWTSAGAAGPDGSDLVSSYTVERDGSVYFILTGSGAGGADANNGGGSASAATGQINAQANDVIVITAAAANRFDSSTTAGQPGRASSIEWRRGATTLATITAPGGKAPTSSTAAGQADEVTPANAPNGISNYVRFRGEGSTSNVLSGETSRGGTKNGGRGYFTQNGGGSQYAGRWDPSSLRWQPSEHGWGDGTQSHDGTQSWNAIPPGIVFLWQDPIQTTYVITNNRTDSVYPLQTELFDFHLDAAGTDTSQDITSIPESSSNTIIFDGLKTGTSWEAKITGITTDTFDDTVGDPGGGSVAGSSIQIDRESDIATYSRTVTYTRISGSGGSPPIGTINFSKSSFSYAWHNRTFSGNQSSWGTSHVRETNALSTCFTKNVNASTLRWKYTSSVSGYTQNPYYFTIKITGTWRESSSGSFITGTKYYKGSISINNRSLDTASFTRHSSNPGNPNQTSVASGGGSAEATVKKLYDLTNCTVLFYFNSSQPGTSSANFAFYWGSGTVDGPGYKWRARKVAGSGPATITYARTNITDIPLTESYQYILTGRPESSIRVIGQYTVADSSSTSVTTTAANTATGVGYYGISEEDSPPICATVSQSATSNVPAISFDISPFDVQDTSSNSLGQHFIDELSEVKEFTGRDPSVPGQTQPPGALYYLAKTATSSQVTITRVDIDAGALISIQDETNGVSEFTHTGTPNASHPSPVSRTNRLADSTTSTDGFGFKADISFTPWLDTEYTVDIAAFGFDYQVGDTITYLGTSLSGTSPANDLVLTLTEVDDTYQNWIVGTSTGTNSYTNVSQTSTSGSGTGATFDVETDGSGNYLVTYYNTDKSNVPGSGYAVNDTITIAGTSLGGTSPANDLTIYVKEVLAGGTNDGSLDIDFFTQVDGVNYPATQFGGALTDTLTVISSAGSGTVTAPVARVAYDGLSKDIILFGTNDQDTIANKLALSLQGTSAWTASSSTNNTDATRVAKGPNTGSLVLSVVSDPDNVLPSGFAQTASLINPGFTSSAGNTASITLNVPQSQFLPSQSITFDVTGTEDTILDATAIADLIRAQTLDGWTIGGSGGNVTFTTVQKYSVNRLDNGAGTGTVQNKLINIEVDDDNGLYRVYADPLQDKNASETTAGITIHYAEPTVYRITYSTGDIQDFVFGGINNGARTVNDLWLIDKYTGGNDTTKYTTSQISSALANSIKSYAGQRLSVSRNAITNQVTASPVQYSQDGLWIDKIELLTIGTKSPSVLAAEIPNPVTDATLSSTVSYVNTFDPDRPWPIDQIKKGRNYPIFVQTTNNADGTVNNSRIRAADIGYTFGGDPYNNVTGAYYVSYVEKRDLPISPEFETEEISTMALWADGGTKQVLGGSLYRATLNIRMTGANSTATLANIKGSPDITNQFSISDDYKIDMRVNGRFTNFRIDDGNVDGENDTGVNPNKWTLSSYQFDVEKGGTR